MLDRNLDGEGEHVEPLEAVDAVAALTEIVVEDARVEQVEDARRIGEEPVLARPGENRLAARYGYTVCCV